MTSATIRALWAEHTGGSLGEPQWSWDQAACFRAADAVGETAGDLWIWTRYKPQTAKYQPRATWADEGERAAMVAIRAALAASGLEVGT